MAPLAKKSSSQSVKKFLAPYYISNIANLGFYLFLRCQIAGFNLPGQGSEAENELLGWELRVLPLLLLLISLRYECAFEFEYEKSLLLSKRGKHKVYVSCIGWLYNPGDIGVMLLGVGTLMPSY